MISTNIGRLCLDFYFTYSTFYNCSVAIKCVVKNPGFEFDVYASCISMVCSIWSYPINCCGIDAVRLPRNMPQVFNYPMPAHRKLSNSGELMFLSQSGRDLTWMLWSKVTRKSVTLRDGTWSDVTCQNVRGWLLKYEEEHGLNSTIHRWSLSL